MAWLSDSWRVFQTGPGASELANKFAGSEKLEEKRKLAKNLRCAG